MEQSCRSAWLSQVLEKHSSHFVGMVGSTSDAAPMDAGIEEESILEALDSGFDEAAMDSSPTREQEIQAMIKEYEVELTMTEDTASTMGETTEYSPVNLEDLTADEFFAFSAEEQEVLMAGRGRPRKKPAVAAGDTKPDEKIPEVHDAQELRNAILPSSTPP